MVLGYKYKSWLLYLYYWITTQSSNILNISSGTGAQPNLSTNKLMKFKLQVPPLEVQNEIVNVLDNFTEILSSLLLEHSARQKQYEYYKDKLLKFKKLTNK